MTHNATYWALARWHQVAECWHFMPTSYLTRKATETIDNADEARDWYIEHGYSAPEEFEGQTPQSKVFRAFEYIDCTPGELEKRKC